MNLIIDIGNTLAKLIVFDGDTPIEEVRTHNKTLDALPTVLNKYSFEKAIVASVIDVPATTEALLSSIPCPTLRLTSLTPIPVVINQYLTPQTLGVDRIAAVVGAAIQKPGKDILIVDIGTCITYEFVNCKGHYTGGNISPGLGMRLESLKEKTDRLPMVSIGKGDRPLMGYDTETAIRSGVLNGIKYEIEGYINVFRKRYPSLLCLLTGGDCLDFDTPTKSIISVDKYLVAKGLNRILEYNI